MQVNGPILYMSGVPRRELADMMVGLMFTPQMHNGPDWTEQNVWCADTGCFRHPERFDLDRYIGWLKRRNLKECIFATAPDVLGDARATLDRSRFVLPLIRELGIPAALVAQDGLENLTIPWNDFDCLFIGGSTAWKLGFAVRQLAAEAKTHGKWLHMGRVNSLRRIRYAQAIGCDSADGTFLAFHPTVNLDKLAQWLLSLEQELGFGGTIDDDGTRQDFARTDFRLRA